MTTDPRPIPPVPIAPAHRRSWRTLWRRCSCGLAEPCVDRLTMSRPLPTQSSPAEFETSSPANPHGPSLPALRPAHPADPPTLRLPTPRAMFPAESATVPIGSGSAHRPFRGGSLRLIRGDVRAPFRGGLPPSFSRALCSHFSGDPSASALGGLRASSVDGHVGLGRAGAHPVYGVTSAPPSIAMTVPSPRAAPEVRGPWASPDLLSLARRQRASPGAVLLSPENRRAAGVAA